MNGCVVHRSKQWQEIDECLRCLPVLGAATGPTSAAMPVTDLKVILTNDDGPISPFFDAWVMHVRNRLKWVPRNCVSLAAWTNCLRCPIGFEDWCAAVQMECCGLHTVARAEFRVQVHHLLTLPGTSSAFALHTGTTNLSFSPRTEPALQACLRVHAHAHSCALHRCKKLARLTGI